MAKNEQWIDAISQRKRGREETMTEDTSSTKKNSNPSREKRSDDVVKKKTNKEKHKKKSKKKKTAKERDPAEDHHHRHSPVSEATATSGFTDREAVVAANQRRILQQGRPQTKVMTREEYEMQQSQVRRVFDEETQRWRLVKGTGEVLEEIVSRQRHQEINKASTAGDGASFARTIGLG